MCVSLSLSLSFSLSPSLRVCRITTTLTPSSLATFRLEVAEKEETLKGEKSKTFFKFFKNRKMAVLKFLLVAIAVQVCVASVVNLGDPKPGLLDVLASLKLTKFTEGLKKCGLDRVINHEGIYNCHPTSSNELVKQRNRSMFGFRFKRKSNKQAKFFFLWLLSLSVWFFDQFCIEGPLCCKICTVWYPIFLLKSSINMFSLQRPLHPVRSQQRRLRPREVVPGGGRLLLEGLLPHRQRFECFY